MSLKQDLIVAVVELEPLAGASEHLGLQLQPHPPSTPAAEEVYPHAAVADPVEDPEVADPAAADPGAADPAAGGPVAADPADEYPAAP